MNAPSLDQIVQAVLAWQQSHPLAERLQARAVHSVGLVALPFLKAGAEEALAPSGWKARLLALLPGRRGQLGGDRPAFSEQFIEGMDIAAAARFAALHGLASIEGADDWPQRRIEVDSDLAAADGSAGWPYERWLATAAIEGGLGRRRVLVGLGEGQVAVLGRRLWDRQRLMLAGSLLAALAVAAAVLWRAEPAPAPVLRVAGAVQGASAASAPTLVASAATSASAAMATASAAASIAASAPAPAPASEAAGPLELPIDIRPRLGPVREAQQPRPPLGAGALASAPTAAAASSAPSAAAAASAPPERAKAPMPQRLREIQGPVVALVSPAFAKRAEAEAMLERMREHLTKTLGRAPEAEIFETPQGFRAACWPFASREEAQILNATMVARGWKTRAVDF